MVKKLIRNLKTLFHNWIYFRDEDEDNYHNWINEYTGYIQGSFSVSSGLPVTINQTFGNITVNVYGTLFHLVITVPEGLNQNQNFYINNASITACTISSTNKTIDVKFNRTNSENPVLMLEPRTENGYYYAGCTTTFRMN